MNLPFAPRASDVWLVDGSGGAPIETGSYQYYSHSGEVSIGDSSTFPVTVYPLASTTDYPVAGDAGNETDYTYTWWNLPGTDTPRAQEQQVTTYLPIVTAAENGPGGTTHWTEQEYFGQSGGNPIWQKDADGILTYNVYDPVTDLLTETIADAGSTSGLTLPSGWSYSDTGINATTDYQYNDPLGRLTQALGPQFVDAAGDTVRTATWTSYIDAPISLEQGQGEGGLGTEVITASGFEVVTPGTGSAYAAGDYVLVNPVSLQISNLDGQTTDQIQGEIGSGLTVVETGSNARQAILADLAGAATLPTSSYSRWTHNVYSTVAGAANGGDYGLGQLTDMEVYTAIQAVPSAVYDQTYYRYNTVGEQSEVMDPSGNITQTNYNCLGLATSVYVGTSDGTTWQGGFSTSASDNMVEVTSNQYDDGQGGGDGLLTCTTQYVDANSADDRLTQYGYDWRDRLTTTTTSDGTTTYIDVSLYDNDDDVIEQIDYHGSIADDNRIGDTLTAFDSLGQVYQTTVIGVDPANGQEDCGSLVSNTFRDADGNVLETEAGGSQQWTKTTYNGLGEPIAQYVGFDPSGDSSTWASASSVAGDVILQQTDTQYDPAGDTTLATTYERYDDAPATDYGALNALGAADSRASYVAYWFDGIGRETAEQNFGAAAAAPSPSAAQPATDTTGATQVSLTDYNARGEAYETVDPAGNVTLTTDDDSGRTIETIQNYSTTIISPATNITTNYAYNTLTSLLSATSVTTELANLSGTQTQITAYVYGTATDDSNPLIYRDDLVCAVVSGLTPSDNLSALVGDIEHGTTTGLNVVEYQFDKQGETIQMTDQNGTQHEYALDGLGRQVSDTATVLGADVYGGADNPVVAGDPAVLRIDTAYDFQGNVALTTSYSSTSGGTANIVNQVADTYNGFGLLTEEQQSVSGAVTSSTPAVYYGYSTDPATPTLLTNMTYPNGRVLTYGYDTGADAAVGRVSYLADSDGTVLAQYKYLGLDQIDCVNSPQPGVTLDLGQKNGNGQLADVDQFNRATDMVFAEYGAANVDELQYGYDVSGNDLWEAQPTAASYGAALDELYSYNALNELTSATRGTLNSTDTAITANQNLTESWSLDGMGNWSTYTQTGGVGPVDQQANTNALNEITSYESPSAWATPGYDAAGNMITTPQPGSEATGLNCVYDAWNRLVEVENASTSTVLATYSYDGLNRRITETANGQTTAFYFSPLTPGEGGHHVPMVVGGGAGEADQVLEERVSSSPLPLGEGQGEGGVSSAAIFAAVPANLQYVWGLRNVDDLILRDSNNGTGGSLGISGSGLGLRLYALQDANWNVVALVNTSGAVQERIAYTAYGTATALNPDFSAPYSGTNFQWTRLFAAMDVDPETGLSYDSARWYNSSLGVFTTTDPAAADPNTYQYAWNNPLTATDPSGLAVACPSFTWDPDANSSATPEELQSFLDAVEQTGEADQARQDVLGTLGSDLSNVPGGAIDRIANKYPSLVNRTLFGGFQGTIVSVPGPVGGTGTSYMFEEGWWGYYYLVGQQSEATPGDTYSQVYKNNLGTLQMETDFANAYADVCLIVAAGGVVGPALGIDGPGPVSPVLPQDYPEDVPVEEQPLQEQAQAPAAVEGETQSAFTLTNRPVDLNRPPIPGRTGSSSFGGTYVSESNPTTMTPQEYTQFVQENVPGSFPSRATEIQVPKGGVLPDPSVPSPAPGTGWIAPNTPGASVVREWVITYDEWGNPTFTLVGGE